MRESQPNEKPTVLIVTTSPSFSPARLAMALAQRGSIVEAVCLTRHPLSKTRAVRRIHPYYRLACLRSVRNAIASVRPDLVIPTDDLAVQHLHDLHSREQGRGRPGARTCALIEQSLGAPASFSVVYARATLLQLAREEGVRVPATAAVSDRKDLEDWAGRNGFPAVLKADRTSGGDGVRTVRTLEEAERSLRALQSPPLLARALKRTLIDQDMGLLWPALKRNRYVVNVQKFVQGRDATSAAACWKGKVLASVHFEVLNKQDSHGPSTVLRLIDSAEMSVAVEKLVRRLGLSGLHGFDFMIEEQSGDPYLIEINPRATQIGHLALGAGRDIPSALHAVASGATVEQEMPAMTNNDTIVLFPQEWLRNPASPFLTSGHHDVPWEDPDFIRFCVKRYGKQMAWNLWNKRLESTQHKAAKFEQLRSSTEPEQIDCAR